MKAIVATLYTADLNGNPSKYTYLYSDAAHASVSGDSSYENADAQCIAAGRLDLVGKFGARGNMGFAPVLALATHLGNQWNANTTLEIDGQSFVVFQVGLDAVKTFTLSKVLSDGRAIPVLTGPVESVISRLATY